jgi:hypothetical protein
MSPLFKCSVLSTTGSYAMTASLHSALKNASGAVPMTRSSLLTGALCALLLPALGCNLLDVSDSENTAGRGARVFDPYQSSASGAIRMSLQWYNGCAIMPTGQTVPKNATPIPYPDNCPDVAALPGFARFSTPGPMRIMANTTYFLNQFTVTDTVVNVHTNPGNLSEPLDWITRKSRFKSLDWGNVGQTYEEWQFVSEITGVAQNRWTRMVNFDNANWRRVQGDSFKVEFLDAEGTVRGTPVDYLRSEFLVETPVSGHSTFAWRMEGVKAPRFPGDTAVNPLDEIPGWPSQAPTFRTMARLDLFGSTNPFKTFKTPDLRGDGAVRVTWSQMPNEPFYFPVTFVTQDDLPPTCYDDAGNPGVQCGFGIDPQLKFVPPANGKFYAPGETVNVMVDARDGDGNHLTAPDMLPTPIQVNSNQANGLLYTNLAYMANTQERDMMPYVDMAGPLQNMRPRSNPREPGPYFAPTFPYSLVDETATTPVGLAQMGQNWATRFGLQLPANVQPGTYVALVKLNRYFVGERVTKMKPFFFQVGTEEKTRYPDRVGNCQMCHRGVLSLDNLRHGLSVDHVEACKTCHQSENSFVSTFTEAIHKIHMRSPKYSMPRNDCTMCHLVRDSATRPSLAACDSCHLAAHGTEYFQAKFVAGVEPSAYGNCAQQCHGEKPPQLHILPEH